MRQYSKNFVHSKSELIFLQKRIIIASDIDGTLVTGKLRLPLRNKLAAKRFAKRGGELVIASGRSPLSMRKYKNMLTCSDRSIVFNGAAVYDYSKNEYVWSSMLNKPEMMPFVQGIHDRFPNVGIELWCGDGSIYQIRHGYDNTARETVEGLKFRTIDISEVHESEKFFKILISGNAEDISLVWEYCREHSPENAAAVCSCPYYCEILNKNANKMTAFNALVSLEDRAAMRIAMGDYYNDMEMIEGADFSAAPKNAADDIKNAADIIVCDCRRGAVAELIDYVIKHFMEVS